MKKLLIVESPAKVKTISKILGNEFIVTSTVGHIKDLPQKTLGLIIHKDNTIDPEYTIMPKKEDVIKIIQEKSKNVDEVYLAPDPDREGEAIAQHTKEIIEEVLKKKIPIKRITFNEITQKAILEGLKNPRSIDMNLVQAQQTRRILDRLVGYQVSPILWRKIGHGLSAGRVQSVALKLVIVREDEIKKFVIKEYWSIHPILLIDNNPLTTTLIKYRNNKFENASPENVKDVIKTLEAEKQWKITEIKEGKRSRKPLPPFITSTLQQAAYNQLGFSVQQTMSIAQKLYEGLDIHGDTKALITYMRSDSTRLSDDALKEIRSFISSTFKKEYLPPKAILYGKSGSAQDAHEAIRPVDVTIRPDYLKGKIDANSFKLYTLIWNRSVACQMESAQYATRTITFESPSHDACKLAGSTLLFDGYLKLYNDVTEDEQEGTLPPELDKNAAYNLKKIDAKQHFTQPPARYSEATLVKELEKLGIGRPSTYGAILKTITGREYTRLDEKKRFVPTEKGYIVTLLLDENFSNIMDVNFTAEMEEDLDKIAAGEKSRDDIIKLFYKHFSEQIEQFTEKKIDKNFRTTTIECPKKCGSMLCVKIGKNGEFLACPGYPECTFTSNFKSDDQGNLTIEEKKEATILDLTCPTCQKNLASRQGRFGEFVACSGYPECKYIYKKTTKTLCPGCNKHPLTENKWRGSTFWGCKSYPDCKYSLTGEVIEKTCAECQFPFMRTNLKTGMIQCSSKECPTNAGEKPAAKTKRVKKSDDSPESKTLKKTKTPTKEKKPPSSTTKKAKKEEG